MENTEFLKQLNTILGEDGIVPTESLSFPSSWKSSILAAAAPAHVSQLSPLIMEAAQSGTPLLPIGGGVDIQNGYPPKRGSLLISTKRMNRILDYQPEDMIVTCDPGITLAEIQKPLALHNQRIALDPPLPEIATMAGIVSANRTGFTRGAYGAPRDQLIGLRAVMADGQEIKGGGKVVKNVAGYDLCKLFTGSWGSLGFLTELTFKTRVLPETTQLVAWQTPDLITAIKTGSAFHLAQLSCSAAIATNELEGSNYLLSLLEGSASRVAWQIDAYSSLAAKSGIDASPILMDIENYNSLNNRIPRLNDSVVMAVKISARPSDILTIIHNLQHIENLFITVDCATGIIHLASNNINDLLPSHLDTILPSTAHSVWSKVDPSYPDIDSVMIWGRLQEDFPLQRALKQKLDPDGLFSPGRFIGKL